MSYGVGHRCGSGPTLLWLWCRLAAIAPIQSLAWELPYAVGMALKKENRKKKKKKKLKLELKSEVPCLGNTERPCYSKNKKTKNKKNMSCLIKRIKVEAVQVFRTSERPGMVM